MSEKRDIYQQALQKLYPFQPSDDAGRALDYHKLAVIFALSTRDDLLAAVFPFEGKPDPDAFDKANIGIDMSRIPKKDIEKLAPYRESFAGVLRAWLEFSNYEEPPCPSQTRLTKIVEVTKQLQGV